MQIRLQIPPDYLNPDLPNGLTPVRIRVIEASHETVKVYGWLVNDPSDGKVEITRWPAQGGRPVVSDSGDEGAQLRVYLPANGRAMFYTAVMRRLEGLIF